METIPKSNQKDFTPKYYTAQDIVFDESLTSAQQTTELVKHHSMALFGLAVDLAKILDENEKLRRFLKGYKSQIKQLQRDQENGITDKTKRLQKDCANYQQLYYKWKRRADELKKKAEAIKGELNDFANKPSKYLRDENKRLRKQIAELQAQIEELTKNG